MDDENRTIQRFSESPEQPGPKHSGSQLVEITIALSIIGLFAVTAAPSLRRARTKSQITAAANDARVFRETFARFCTEKGYYPADTHETLPVGTSDYIDEGRRSRITALESRLNTVRQTWLPVAGIFTLVSLAFQIVRGTTRGPASDFA